MSSALIQPRKNGASIDRLNTSQQVFVKELLADDLWRPTEAARRAGYVDPASAACRLMKMPAIQAMLGKEQRRRLERIGLKADEVLHMLATALFFNPLTLFKPTKDGNWAVVDLDAIPDDIGRCISKIKTKTITNDDGEVTYFEIEFLDKTRLLELALKHCGIAGGDKLDVNMKVDGAITLSHLLHQVEQKRRAIVDDRVLEGMIVEQQTGTGNADQSTHTANAEQ